MPNSSSSPSRTSGASSSGASSSALSLAKAFSHLQEFEGLDRFASGTLPPLHKQAVGRLQRGVEGVTALPDLLPSPNGFDGPAAVRMWLDGQTLSTPLENLTVHETRLASIALYYAPEFSRLDTTLLSEASWTDIFNYIIRETVKTGNEIYDGPILILKPLNLQPQYSVDRDRVRKLGINLLKGTKTDISIGFETRDFKFFHRGFRREVSLHSVFYDMSMFTNLNQDETTLISLPFFHHELKATDAVGWSQLATAMLSTLVLVEELRAAAQRGDQAGYDKLGLSEEKLVMMTRIYGMAPVGSRWKFYVMWWTKAGDGRRRFSYKALPYEVSQPFVLFQALLFIKRIMNEAISDKSPILKNWLTLASTPSPGASNSPSATGVPDQKAHGKRKRDGEGGDRGDGAERYEGKGSGPGPAGDGQGQRNSGAAYVGHSSARTSHPVNQITGASDVGCPGDGIVWPWQMIANDRQRIRAARRWWKTSGWYWNQGIPIPGKGLSQQDPNTPPESQIRSNDVRPPSTP